MEKKMSKLSGKLLALMCSALMLCSFLMSGVVVNADVATTEQFSTDVKTELTSNVDDYHGGNYTASGGGSLGLNDLLELENGLVKINEANFSKLTSSAQSDFISDLDKAANKVAGATTNGYTDESITNWYSILQQQDGVGSKMLNVVLQNTKPDFVTANRIYQPFSGLVGTVLGLGAVLIMAFLAIVMVCDIAYITLPPIRLFVGDGESKDGRAVKSNIFSHDAIYAVEVAETKDSGSGSPKQALGVYFKRRVFMLILLGICLLYLVQGSIFSIVGMILDLVSGFTG